MTLKERAKQIKTDIPAVFLAIKDRRTPWYAKALGGLAIVYALSPIDLIPDFIPFFGMLDDLIILPILITWTIRLVPKDVLAEARQTAATLWASGAPKKWRYAIPFVAIWLFVLFLLAKAFIPGF
ncbi:MAG: YkvA family protein [Bacillus subtilis]|nr:YkvA family protein [Bacillus subtilis]